MKNSYSCPRCHSKQKIKHLFLMSNNTTWHCDNCNTLLKPEKMTNLTFIGGFLSTVIPACYSIIFLKNKLSKSLFIGLICGLIGYLIIILYYYFNIKLEEV